MNFIWQADYIGHELGYDNVSVIGYYISKDNSFEMYINAENNEVVDKWEVSL